MDIFEKVFQKLWTPSHKVIRSKPSTYALEELKPYLQLVSQFILGEGGIKEISASRSYSGFVDDHLYLPGWIGWSNKKSINKSSYLYLTLVASMAKKLKLKSELETESKIAKRMEFVRKSHQINLGLDDFFQGFGAFQENYFYELKNKFSIKTFDPFYLEWSSQCQSRKIHLENLDSLRNLKSNDDIPEYLLFSTVNLFNELDVQAEEVAEQNLSQSKKSTEQKRVESHPVLKTDFEKEKDKNNPISHSFEKLETADDYKGGFRQNSGDDDLEDHLDALEELDLSSITTQGESAQSLYSSDTHHVMSVKRNKEHIPPIGYSYPEWFSKSNTYEKNYCSLFELQGESGLLNNLKEKVENTYKSEILKYKSQLERIVNQPTWNKKQLEGAELDLDECVRFRADVLSKNVSQTPRLYITKNKSFLDLAVYILFDQSLSTDSWVDNARIFDVIRDSLVMLGILFEDIVPQVQIAGTWSASRKNCVFNIVKDRDDTWETFYSKISSAEPQGYTRLGPALRHIKTKMKEEHKKKVLIILTDGKPSDIDMYEGVHGIQDIKKAYAELDNEGIVPIAILIDKEEKNHFQSMFKRHFVVSNPKKLPDQLFQVLSGILK